MSKFDYNNFYLDDNEWCVCNANKYTQGQALEIAKIELAGWENEVDKSLLIIESAYVRYGFGVDLNGERRNGYWLEFEPKGNCTEVWAVSKKKQVELMSETKLKRCPFCGGGARLDRGVANAFSVECTICHASSPLILCTAGDMEQKAIEAWNTRIPMQNIVERLEEKETKYHDDYIENLEKEKTVLTNVCFGSMVGIQNAIKILKEEGDISDQSL